MKNTLQNDILTIYLEGELNSFNSEAVEKEIDEIVKAKKFKKILLDFKDLVYISSAGLRIIVRLKQQFDNIALINVSNEVYEIFVMVGFENILDIKKI